MATGTILVADDEALIRRVLVDTLSERGYQVEAVETGAQAWALLQNRPFDLAFVDIRMPELSGLDLLLKVQEAHIETAVVIVTAQTTLTNAIEAMKRGAFDYLAKPFDLNDVQALASRALEARRLSTNVAQPLPAVHGRNDQIIGSGAAMQQPQGRWRGSLVIMT